MQKKVVVLLCLCLTACLAFSFKNGSSSELYVQVYDAKSKELTAELNILVKQIEHFQVDNEQQKIVLQQQILNARKKLKGVDFWFRYLEPLAYKSLNGPLPVEWETEVFEKFEKPYKRVGAGLSLGMMHLEEDEVSVDTLKRYLHSAILANIVYEQDSIKQSLQSFDHFYFCNRLYLLNLAAIYTTGFECPNTDVVIPELLEMLGSTLTIYEAYNASYPATSLSPSYLDLYAKAILFVRNQPQNFESFNHYLFIRDFVNPLYALNAGFINLYKAKSKSTQDYSLAKQASSIFDKNLYEGQSTKGVFYNVQDKKALALIDRLGKLLFFDPILSANNERSCASCHNPAKFFTDTIHTRSFDFDHKNLLARNTPSLLNVQYNHLAMLDGAHISLQDQTKAVIQNPKEMASDESELMQKVLSCDEYRKGFTELLNYTPQETSLNFEHIVSALTFYYSKFSQAISPFDKAMNGADLLSENIVAGFNLFMSKAACATCHFVPQFNGVKPPFIGSEFEVLGTPLTKDYKNVSDDKGRYLVHPATETMNAFRTGSLRNIMGTAPYMHNGVFSTMDEVIDFYDAGGGVGNGLTVPNQTLSADSLKLTSLEKTQLKAFLNSLTEAVEIESPPKKLPLSKNKMLNKRLVGGSY